MKDKGMQPEHIETATRVTAGTVATILSYTSSGSLLIFGMTASDFASLTAIAAGFIGIILGIGTFAVNWYYRRKEYEKK